MFYYNLFMNKSSLLIILFSALTASVLFAAEEYTITASPAWIRTINIPDYTPSSDEITDGEYYFLSDIQLNGRTGEYYNHYAVLLTNSRGLENNSQVSVDFDPHFEELHLHKISIIRKDVESDRLEGAMTSVIQQEKELEKLLYNGTESFYAILSDIRVGDILEVSYTISGKEKLFTGLNDRLYMEWGVPVKKVYRRVLSPAGNPLHWRTNKETAEPFIDRDKGEFIWERNDVEAVEYEDNVPYWFDGSNYLEISQYASWDEVRKEIEKLYDPLELDTDQAEYIYSQYPALEDTRDPKVITALLLDAVQEEIRYMGVEIGRGSFIPAKPYDVYTRRFGDCKDKSLLLVKLLRHKGIDAFPVLVHNSTGKNLINVLPGPYQFNHVITKVVIDGKTYWLDPTMTCQEGDLDLISMPRYGYGLVLWSGDQGLEEMGSPFSGVNTRISEEFVLPGETDGEGAYLITTEYYDEDADYMRSWLSNTTPSEVSDSLVDFLSDYYENIEIADDFTWDDDVKGNVLILKEHYTIPGVWEYINDDDKFQFSYSPYEIYNYTWEPDGKERTMPYYLRHPYTLEQTVSISLPDIWNITGSEESFETDHFAFHRDISYTDRKVTLHYTYQSREDSVPPEEMDLYREKISKLSEGIDYIVFWNPLTENSGGDGRNFISAGLSILIAALVIYRVISLRKKSPGQMH